MLLHGDGQYAPELLARDRRPLERGEAEAVFGSRIMNRAGPAAAACRPTSTWATGSSPPSRTRSSGTDLSEWHSGYRAYDVQALAQLPFERQRRRLRLRHQIIIQLHEAGMRITEIPIPTYYGDEICYVNGIALRQGRLRDVVRYRAHKMGFGTGEMAFAVDRLRAQGRSPRAPMAAILRWLGMRPPSRILDLGCSDGTVGSDLMAQATWSSGSTSRSEKGVRQRLTDFVEGDLEQGIPAEAGDGFDIVLAADVLEHVRDPAQMLDHIAKVLRPRWNPGHEHPELRPLVSPCCGWRSAASTTTPAASSTEVTSGSSRSAHSPI